MVRAAQSYTRRQRLALEAFQVEPPLQCHTQGTPLSLVTSTRPMANACLTPGTAAILLILIFSTVAPRFFGTPMVWRVHLLVAADQLQRARG